MALTLDDFKKLTSLNGDVGTAAGFNRILTGGIFTPDMLKVKDYEFIDWTPAFPNENINKYNIVLGYKATITPETVNSIAIGNNAIATGDDTVQLGWHKHKVTTFDGIYRRADSRDMDDIEDVTDALKLIDALKPIKFKYNYRDKLIEDLYPYPHPINEPTEPNIDNFNLPLEDGTVYFDKETYDIAVEEYNKLLPYYTDYITKAKTVRSLREAAYKSKRGTDSNSKIRYGFSTTDIIIDDFNPVLKQISHNGYDTEYLAYDELIAPIVSAIQEEHKLIKKLRLDTDDQYKRLEKLDGEMVTVNEHLTALDEDVSGIATDLVNVEKTATEAKELAEAAGDLTDVYSRIEALEQGSGSGGTGGSIDLTAIENDIIDLQNKQNTTTEELGKVNTRLDNLEQNPGGGSSGGTTTGSARNLDVDYSYSYRLTNIDGTTKYSVIEMNSDENIVFGSSSLRSIYQGMYVDIKGGVQVDLWAGSRSVKWLGSDLSPVVSDHQSMGGITLGSDRDDAFRWTSIYLWKDPNISSDARLKQDKRPLDEREKAAALEIKDSIGLYKLVRSIEYKGSDEARLHAGVYAQEIVSIMESHNLNPFDYSFIGVDNSENKHFNIRYGELTMFILAAL